MFFSLTASSDIILLLKTNYFILINNFIRQERGVKSRVDYSMNIMLKIANLSVEINKKIILNNFNLTIEPGTIHAIMGPNGVGKSTLSRVIMGDQNIISFLVIFSLKMKV